jgi:nucleoid DNA-binding protein
MTKNAQQLVGELVNSANNLITETTNKDGSTKYNINWQEFNKPQHKDLRKRFVNSGARDLFKYYDRRGNVRQGAFDDIYPVDDQNVVIATTKPEEDNAPGQMTENRGSSPDEGVSLIPKQTFESIGNSMLQALLETANPGFGWGSRLEGGLLGMVDKQVDLNAQEAVATLKANDPDYANDKVLEEKLEREIAELVAGSGEEVDPQEITTAVLEKTEELNEVTKRIENKESKIPFTITTGESKDPLGSVASHMARVGMSEEQIQVQNDRHNATMEKVYAAGLKDRTRPRNKALIASKRIANEDLLNFKYFNGKATAFGDKDRPSKLQDYNELKTKIENGAALDNEEAKRFTKYQNREKQYEEKVAKYQTTIDEIILGANVKTKPANWTPPSGSGPAWETGPTTDDLDPQTAGLHSDQTINESLLDQKRRNLLDVQSRLAIKEEGWNSVADIIKAKAPMRKKYISLMGVTIRQAQFMDTDAGSASAIDMIGTFDAMYQMARTGSLMTDKEMVDIQSKTQTHFRGMQTHNQKLVEFAMENNKVASGLLKTISENLLTQEGTWVLEDAKKAKVLPAFQELSLAREAAYRAGADDATKKQYDRAWEESLGLMILGDLEARRPGPLRTWIDSFFGENVAEFANAGGIINSMKPRLDENGNLQRIVVTYAGGQDPQEVTKSQLKRLVGDSYGSVVRYFEKKPVIQQGTNNMQVGGGVSRPRFEG